MKPTMVVDIDETLADVFGDRDRWWLPRFLRDPYRGKCASTPPHQKVLDLCHKAHDEGVDVVIVTARTTLWRWHTWRWLERNEVPVDMLFMRSVFNRDEDWVYKASVIGALEQDGHEVVLVIDNDPHILASLNAMGIKTLDANEARRELA